MSSAESGWDERIERARALAAEHSAAAGILTFYASLAGYQRSLCCRPPQSWGPPLGGPIRLKPDPTNQLPDPTDQTPDFFQTVDLDGASAAVPDFLAWLQEAAPEPLARAAAAMSRLERQEWRQLMDGWLTQPDVDHGDLDDRPRADDAMAFVMEAVVQPFTAAAAIAWRADGGPKPSAPDVRASRCPICFGRPVVAILREEGHGARRTLLCARCLNEWEFPRVVCPACDEQRFDALPVYTADAFSHVRIDACDSCKRVLEDRRPHEERAGRSSRRRPRDRGARSLGARTGLSAAANESAPVRPECN